MGRGRGGVIAGSTKEYAPRHAEVDDDHRVGREEEHDVLPPSPDLCKGEAPELTDELRWWLGKEIRADDAHLGHASPNEVGP